MSEENVALTEPVDVENVVEDENIESESSDEKTQSAEEQGEQTNTEDEDNEEDAAKPKKSGFEKRVSKLNARIAAQEREAAFWKAEALKNQPQSNQEQVQQVHQVQEVAKPTLAQFNNDIEAYTDAVTEWKLYQRDVAYQNQQKQLKQSAVLDSYNARVAEYVKTNPTFYDDLAEANDVPTSPEINQIVTESDFGPAIVHYLSQNLDEVIRLNKLPAHRRLIELGKIEDRVSTKTPIKVKSARPAPAPVKPVTGAAPVIEKSVYEMSPQELIAHRNKKSRR